MAGRETDTPEGRMIQWSQPEILLYDDDPYIRMSYPDLVEQDGKFFVTETQKTIGHTHEIAADLLQGLFNQWDAKSAATKGLILDLADKKPLPAQVAMPRLPLLNRRDPKSEDQRGQDLRAGFSIGVWFKPDNLNPGQPLLDSRDTDATGILVSIAEEGSLRITLNDGRSECTWSSDKNLLTAGKPHHAVITVDGGPKIITFVVDGVLCDGGNQRQFGWGHFSPYLRTPNGASMIKIAPAVQALSVYGRAIRTSEAVGNFKAGCPD